MKTKAKYTRKVTRPRSKDLVNNWWNWEDRDAQQDMEAHQAHVMMSDIPMSQMDLLQELEG